MWSPYLLVEGLLSLLASLLNWVVVSLLTWLLLLDEDLLQ